MNKDCVRSCCSILGTVFLGAVTYYAIRINGSTAEAQIAASMFIMYLCLFACSFAVDDDLVDEPVSRQPVVPAPNPWWGPIRDALPDFESGLGDDKTSQCSICLDDNSTVQCKQCRAQYHMGCAMRWPRECATCRFIPPVDVH